MMSYTIRLNTNLLMLRESDCVLSLKFSHDYEKLPIIWQGTNAILLSVLYVPDLDYFTRKFPGLIKMDTKFRNEDGSYILDFKQAIILVLWHVKSSTLFTTIRKYDDEKMKHYEMNIEQPFRLVRI